MKNVEDKSWVHRKFKRRRRRRRSKSWALSQLRVGMLDMDQNIKTITISEGIKKVFWSMQKYRQAPANHTHSHKEVIKWFKLLLQNQSRSQTQNTPGKLNGNNRFIFKFSISRHCCRKKIAEFTADLSLFDIHLLRIPMIVAGLRF